MLLLMTVATSALSAQTFDAAFDNGNGKAYFFKGNQYIRYDLKSGRADAGYPKTTASIWKGVDMPVIDAALKLHDRNKIYFFYGDQYVRYDFNNGRVDRGYPQPISRHWKGAPSSPDAAVNVGNNTVYFYKGNIRYTYSTRTNSVVKQEQLSSVHRGVSTPSAALYMISDNKKLYLYENERYWRLTGQTVDRGYPVTPITKYWKNLSFGSSNASTGSGSGSGKLSGSSVTVEKNDGERINERPVGSPKTDKTPAGYVCVTKEYNVDASFNQNFILSTTQSELYPGNIINGVAFSNGRVQPMNGARKDYIISESNGGKNTTVSTASISGVRSALRSVLPSATTPASILYDKATVKSQQDLKVFMKAGYDDGINNIKASGGYSSSSGRNTVAVRFMQLYYTVDVDKPSQLTSSHFYTDGTPITQDMLMVSQVGYGRLLTFMVETSYSAEEIEAAISYAGRPAGQEINADLEAKHSSRLENSKINVYAIGGSASNAMKVITGGPDALEEYLSQGAQFSRNSPGVPIFYKLRFVQDWAPANVRFSTKITRTECKQTAGGFNFKFDWMGVVNEADGPGGKEELFGIGYVRAFVIDSRGQKQQVMPTTPGYIGNYGRVFEIKPDNYVALRQGDATPLMSNNYRFDFDASKYGYDSFKDLENKAYFYVVFEVKEMETRGKHEIIGKKEATIYLKDAIIEPAAGRGSAVTNATGPGILQHVKGGTRVVTRYSIAPISE